MCSRALDKLLKYVILAQGSGIRLPTFKVAWLANIPLIKHSFDKKLLAYIISFASVALSTPSFLFSHNIYCPMDLFQACFSNEFSTFTHKIVYMDWQKGNEGELFILIARNVLLL